MSSSPSTLRRELPWLAGVLLAVVVLEVWAHEAPGFPFGSDWGQYLLGADALWRGHGGDAYPSWRGPLYMALLGGLGQVVGYVPAGQAVSRIAAGLCVIAAGLAGRALGGRGVGVAAALLAAGFEPLQQAARWVNPYATMGATWGLCLAAGLGAARTRRPGLAGLAGLFAAAAVATDPRGWLVVPLALGLGALAGVRATASLAATLVLGLALNAWVQRDLPRTPLLEAIRAQHALSAEMVGLKVGPDHPLAACLDADAATARLATTPACARALVAWNLGRQVPRGLLPPPWTLLALPLALALPRWGRRGVPAALLAVGLPLGAMAAGLAWVEWDARYTVPWLVPLAVLGPVALAWLLPPGAGWVRRSLFAAALLPWAAWVLPSTRAWHDPQAALSGEGDLLAFARWVDAEAGAGGEVLNCSQQPVDLLLLPRPTLARHRTAGSPEPCRAWADDPPENALFLTAHDPYSGACKGECAGIDPRASGWCPVPLPRAAPPNVRAWRRAANPSPVGVSSDHP